MILRAASLEKTAVPRGFSAYLLNSLVFFFFRFSYIPHNGSYDLHIRNISYERDNGRFSCFIVETGSGEVVHSKVFELTVLLLPEPPIITPMSPIGLEGKELQINCSSKGGSPPPTIR